MKYKQGKPYNLTKGINPIVLLCSEKREIKACGYTYIEHSLPENIKVLENTITGMCIEYYSNTETEYREFNYRKIIFSDTKESIADTVVFSIGNKVMLFDSKLTRRIGAITIEYFKYLIHKIVSMME